MHIKRSVRSLWHCYTWILILTFLTLWFCSKFICKSRFMNICKCRFMNIFRCNRQGIKNFWNVWIGRKEILSSASAWNNCLPLYMMNHCCDWLEQYKIILLWSYYYSFCPVLLSEVALSALGENLTMLLGKACNRPLVPNLIDWNVLGGPEFFIFNSPNSIDAN